MKNLLFACMLCIVSCSQPQKIKKNYHITTSIKPLAILIQQIGGDFISVTNIMSDTTDPHHFQLSPSEAILLDKSDLIIGLGSHFDDVIFTDPEKSIILISNHVDNPHYWLSFKKSIELANQIAEILSIKFPEHKKLFHSNAQKFITNMENLFQEMLSNNSYQDIAVIQRHDAWGYLLEELGIESLGTIETHHGGQISVKKMQEIITSINKSPKNVLLIEDMFNTTSTIIEALHKETGAKIIFLSPLGSSLENQSIENIIKENLLKIITSKN